MVICVSDKGLPGGAYGAGKHVWTLTIPKVVTIYEVCLAKHQHEIPERRRLTDNGQILFWYTFVYAAAVSSTKISILLFYYRIFRKNAGRGFTVSLGIGGFMAAAYSIIV